MDMLRALVLQSEWGADEAYAAAPQLRTRTPKTRVAAAPALPPTAAAAIGQPTMADWRQAMSASAGGGLAAFATHLVWPVGVPGTVLTVLDSPQAEEDRSGEALASPSGRLLRRMLDSVALGPDHAMVAYLLPWRAPGGRAPSDAEVAACLPFLLALVTVTQPRLVLAAGAIPARALLGATARRGRFGQSAHPGMGCPILPTANPALLLKQPAQKAAAWADLRMLRRRFDAIVTVS